MGLNGRTVLDQGSVPAGSTELGAGKKRLVIDWALQEFSAEETHEDTISSALNANPGAGAIAVGGVGPHTFRLRYTGKSNMYDRWFIEIDDNVGFATPLQIPAAGDLSIDTRFAFYGPTAYVRHSATKPPMIFEAFSLAKLNDASQPSILTISTNERFDEVVKLVVSRDRRHAHLELETSVERIFMRTELDPQMRAATLRLVVTVLNEFS
jgi:hypothetical protein